MLSYTYFFGIDSCFNMMIFWNHKMQHAIIKIGFDFISLYPFRNGKRTRE